MSRRGRFRHRSGLRKKQTQTSDKTGVVGVVFLVALGIGFFVHAAGAHSDSVTHTTSPVATSVPVGATSNPPSPSTSASIPAARAPTTSKPETTSTTGPQSTSTTNSESTSTTNVQRTSTTTVAPTVPPTTVAAPPISASAAARAGQTCHAQGSGDEVLPDPTCTPGAANPEVTQANIDATICRSGWTETVRPPESSTEPMKLTQLAAYGYGGQSPSGFEEDHLIPLELGGSPTSPQNLWPELGASPNPKDAVESAANRAVCDGRMPLATAQQEIASNWIALGQQLGVD